MGVANKKIIIEYERLNSDLKKYIKLSGKYQVRPLCKAVKVTHVRFYKWLNNELELKIDEVKKIVDYLNKDF